MNKKITNKPREIPFLEDFSIKEINNYLNIFLIVSRNYCQIPFEYNIIKSIINGIKKGEYPGFRYSNKIKELLFYSDFFNLFNKYLKEHNLINYSFDDCKIILNKLLMNLEKINSGKEVDKSILSIIKKLKSKDTIIEDSINLTQEDIYKVLDSIFPNTTYIDTGEDNKKEIQKNKKRFTYKREINKKVSIYIEEENKFKSFELIKRILNITILKNKKGEYFLREYLRKPCIKVNLLKGITLMQKQNGKNFKLTLKIEIKNNLEYIIMELEE